MQIQPLTVCNISLKTFESMNFVERWGSFIDTMNILSKQEDNLAPLIQEIGKD